MWRWSRRLVLVALLVAVLAVMPAAALAAAGGTGPDSALAPAGATQSIAMGQRVWYAFQSGGDRESQVMIRLSSSPQGSATFSVWTPANVTDWTHGNTENPTGRGTQEVVARGTGDERTLFGGDEVWSGTFDAPGTYYVVVDQTGPVAGTYRLTVTGSDVTVGAAGAQGQQGTTGGQGRELPPPQTLPATGNQPAPAQARPGSGPAAALALPGGAQTLGVGESRWYTLQSGGTDFQTLIRMSASPQNAAQFSVWSQGDVQNWVNGEGMKPTGRGTRMELDSSSDSPRVLFDGDQVWSGSLPAAGTYYILVEQQGSQPATYKLNVSETLTAAALARGS